MSASSGARRNGAVFGFHCTSARRHPTRRTRLKVRLLRLRLDRRLAAGEPPWSTLELSVRAAELTAPGERQELAEEVDRLIDSAAQPRRPGGGAAVPPDRASVLACGPLLGDLVDDLRHAERVEARGVALVRQLLRDGGSPLYAPKSGAALEHAVRQAHAALLLD
jgi:hypothetical protein